MKEFKDFMISEKYRLEVHWKKAVYEDEGVTRLIGCYLSGPVIKDVSQMSSNDFIRLDFGSQYRVFVSNYYIADLSWKGVEHRENKIYLEGVILKNKHINSVPKLKNSDYFVIDTENHEDEKHLYTFVYTTYLIKETGEQYNFNKG